MTATGSSLEASSVAAATVVRRVRRRNRGGGAFSLLGQNARARGPSPASSKAAYSAAAQQSTGCGPITGLLAAFGRRSPSPPLKRKRPSQAGMADTAPAAAMLGLKMGAALFFWIVLGLLCCSRADGYAEASASAAASGSSVEPDVGHFQPMVALLCGHGRLSNQYLSENQRWVSDPDPKAVCTREKLSILEYCRKVYPKRDIRNIVESSRYYRLDGWCKAGQHCSSGEGSVHWVKPYRCLEGDFQSDALLVPEHCLFDHIHNQSVCQSFDEWNRTAAQSCRGRAMRLRSFAMLLPCGVDIFSGVEFVCCPPASSPSSDRDSQGKDTSSEDDYDDDYSEEDDDDDGTTTTSTTTTTTTTEGPVEQYLSRYDSRHEHAAFRAAQHSLQESHRAQVTRVMREWSELEQHYQAMKARDPKGAEEFRRKMSARFQKTVQALEAEGSAERHRLAAMHRQRVLTTLNRRKKAALDCYHHALQEKPPKTKRVERCLERLLRALEKDRSHTLHSYRQHGGDAEEVRAHLTSLDRLANHSLDMLPQSLKGRLGQLWSTLRGATSSEPLLPPPPPPPPTTAEDSESVEDESILPASSSTLAPPVAPMAPVAPTARPAHAQSQLLQHAEPAYTLRRPSHADALGRLKWSGSVYITLAFAGVALLTALLVGAVLLRRQRSPHARGFVQVGGGPTASPEERHLTAMQVNGYENPTYKYFEAN
ncbi:amyloid-beta-like protein [Dermacentor albipictus]|uniref:amyloid-beta-like protein n=1 Tax=Dermacentor albipictus TaxID=60249 RepID=UPI0031FE2F9D